jgi:Transposase DDE domain group 1
LTSTLHWFETELLTREENLVGLMAVNRDVVGQAETFDRSDRIVIDMDSSESPVHGQQEGSAYNGHFETVSYHPLFLFNDHGDCLAAKLRAGNVHSADDWDELLVPEIERQQAEASTSRSEPIWRLPNQKSTRHLSNAVCRTRSASRPTRIWSGRLLVFSPDSGEAQPQAARPYKSFSYQAGSWTQPRRVAKVEHHVGELFPRVGFIVTNLQLPNRAVVRFYNKRGRAEQWIKEGKQAAHWTRLSCHRFRANEVRLLLSVLAYNLGNLWLRLVLPKRIDSWSLVGVW